MTRIILGLFSLIFVSGFLFLTAGTSVSSQSGRVNNSNWVVQITNAANTARNVNAKPISGVGRNTTYYFELDRPNSGRLPPDVWKQIGATLHKAGIPNMFGSHDFLDYGQEWNPARLTRTDYAEGRLILGPFSSPSAAMNVLNRLPKVLPRKYDDPFEGVRPGPTETPNTWQVGSFQIWGFRSEFPIETRQSSTVHKSGVMDATVVEFTEGGSGASLNVRSKGILYGFCIYGNCGAPRTVIGNVTKEGAMVRIWYKSIGEGNLLEVTKIQVIKKR